MAAASQPHWSIFNFYKRAWTLTWKHKKLWVLGIAMMAFTQSNFNFRSTQRINPRTNPLQNQAQAAAKKPASPIPSAVPDTHYYLPTAFPSKPMPDPLDQPVVSSRAFLEPLAAVAKAAYQRMPGVVILFVIETLALLVGIVTLMIIATSWARVALQVGVMDAAHDALGSLADVTRTSFTRLKATIWLTFVPMLVIFAGLMVAGIVFGIIFSILATSIPVLLIIMVIAALIGGVYGILRLGAALVWAHLYVANDNLTGREAYRKGNKLGAKTYWKVARLGLLNAILVIGVIFVIFAVFGMVGARTFILHSFSVGQFLPMIITSLLLAPVLYLGTAIYYVFVFATFQFGFESVRSLAEVEELPS